MTEQAHDRSNAVGYLRPTVMLRHAGGQDLPFMHSLLASLHYNHTNIFEADIPIRRYVSGWGRPGDTALIALEDGHRIAATWYRLFTASAPGFGFVDPRTPELTLATVPSHHHPVVISDLLTAAISQAQAANHPGISVALDHDHPDIPLYEASGFGHFSQTPRGIVLLCTIDGHAGTFDDDA